MTAPHDTAPLAERVRALVAHMHVHDKDGWLLHSAELLSIAAELERMAGVLRESADKYEDDDAAIYGACVEAADTLARTESGA